MAMTSKVDRHPGTLVDFRGEGGAAGKALNVLKAFIDGQEAWGVRELAAALEQPTTSVHRSLTILRQQGLVEWDDQSGKYRLGTEWHRWAVLSRTRFRLPDLVRPVAETLAAETGESVWLAVFDQTGPHVWAALEVQGRLAESVVHVGQEEPLYADAAGIAVLAHLDPAAQAEAGNAGEATQLQAALQQFARDGFVVGRENADDLSISLAAPILNARRWPLGSLVITLPSRRFAPDRAARLGASLAAAARRISLNFATRFLTGSDAASSQPAIRVLTSVVQERIEGLELTQWGSGGSGKLREIDEGYAAYATAVGSALDAAYLGQEPFRQPMRQLRTVAALGTLQLHVLVAADSPATSLLDLVRLRVSPGERDYGTAILFMSLMEKVGVREADFERAGGGCYFMDYRESNRLFQDGRLDALISLNAAPNAQYRRLARIRPFRLLGLEGALADAAVDENPALRRGRIAAGAYSCVASAIPTLETPLLIVTTRDRSEDEVHAFVEAIHARNGDLAQMSPMVSVEHPAAVLPGCEVPIHPGADRFFASL